MATELHANQTSLYETDFVQWVQTTVDQLRAQNYECVDWANLIEEIEEMSRRERRSLKSNLVVILLHLLKWQYQTDCRSGSWRGSIREHRRRINDDLKESPSLVAYLHEVLSDCYANARAQAADETALPLENFPTDCPYTSEQILNPEFLPD